jgi:hypothetical protein
MIHDEAFSVTLANGLVTDAERLGLIRRLVVWELWPVESVAF